MITNTDLKQIARARLRDAQVLLKASRWDGAVYICGYAVEVALKARISKTLGWNEFPEMNREFDDYRSLRTHKLEVLLRLSGNENLVKSRYAAEWSSVAAWDPEVRYSRVGYADAVQAQNMLIAARLLVGVLVRDI